MNPLLIRRRGMIESAQVVVLTMDVNPSSYDTSDYSYQALNNPTNAYGQQTSSTYAQLIPTHGSEAESWVYYKFDTSALPVNANIVSVQCVAAGYRHGGSIYLELVSLQMYSGFGGLALKESKNISSTDTKTTVTFSGATWTRDELSDVIIKVYVKRGTRNVNTDGYYARFFGATLTINYSI